MGRMQIAGELSIYQVAELKPQLQQVLAQSNRDSEPIALEFSESVECDGAGLQLLLSLAKSAKEFEIPVHLLNPPSELLAMLTTYGVAHYFVIVENANEQ